MSERCEMCGREPWSREMRFGCLGEGSIDCWRIRAERFEAERDGAVATVDLLSEQLAWTRNKLDGAVTLLRRHHSPGAEWQDQPGLHRETEELLARLDAKGTK